MAQGPHLAPRPRPFPRRSGGVLVDGGPKVLDWDSRFEATGYDRQGEEVKGVHFGEGFLFLKVLVVLSVFLSSPEWLDDLQGCKIAGRLRA